MAWAGTLGRTAVTGAMANTIELPVPFKAIVANLGVSGYIVPFKAIVANLGVELRGFLGLGFKALGVWSIT